MSIQRARQVEMFPDTDLSLWREERVLITVKTYPQPSTKDVEVVCTAGIREAGGFIRLFPIPFRFLENSQRFPKWTWIRAKIAKASDSRPESHTVDYETIVLEQKVETKGNWADRWAHVRPLLAGSIEELKERQRRDGTSLGIIRPKEILDFRMRPAPAAKWAAADLAKLQRAGLFQNAPAWLLEKIPVEFVYRFRCDDARCTTVHEMQCHDWETAQAWREWRLKYRSEALFEEKFYNRFRTEMIGLKDTHFFVGTLRAHPTTWTIIGLFYPPKDSATGG